MSSPEAVDIVAPPPATLVEVATDPASAIEVVQPAGLSSVVEVAAPSSAEPLVITVADPPALVQIVNPDATIGPPGPPGAAGPEGPPGPQGPEASPLATYVFTQVSPSSSWAIVHNLKSYPSVTIVDSGGSAVIPNVIYVNDDSLIVSFDSATSGKAYLN
jgi:hypothetical protein